MKVKFSSLQILDNYGKGYADGEEKGYNDGLKTGNEQGYNSALERLETADIKANGTYTPNDIGFKKVVVNVPDLNGDYQTGYNDGYSKGNTDGYSQGYSKGETDGYNDGYTKGENVGYTNGYEQGNTDGFNSGYTQGESVGQENGYNNALSKLDELTVKQNGEYTPSEDKIGFSKVIVETVDENGSYADGAKILGSYIDGSLKEIKAEYLEGVTVLPEYAFYKKTLDLLELPEGITSLPNELIRDCKINTLIIPKSVLSLGYYTFNGATKKVVYYSGTLEDYIYLNRNIRYDSACMFSNTTNQYIDGISIDENYTLEIPTKAVSQGDEIPIVETGKYRFKGLGMGKVIIPNTVIAISGYSFSWCKNLSIIEIPNSVKNIDGRAFEFCEKLTDITLPESITTLGNLIFDRQLSLDNKYTIRLLGTTPPTISTITFTLNGGSMELINQIIVPKGYGEVYKSATNWSAFADYIIESET